ncbi:E3 SUMO-protein ligase ZBED1-like [Melanotaenia boesemani]|uniref:E3 SUMO-protein ligase ZBED1-like n=1 Tax=Melanotaenia boesemani TaxID=1250792 RepID=UPI001C05430F|nr:E3 SUMO-protein ligase ZBED1-like [Melanotaenia boesemani]
MSLTIHYIDGDWKLSNLCLETSFFPDDHTGENLANGLKDFLQSWQLSEDKQVCVTMDSGANVVKALKLNNWMRLSCFGHCLHIAIERSVRDSRIDRAVGVCKKVVNFFSHSWKRQHALENAQKEMGLPQHKLTTESPTRWGSRYKMIMRLLEQEKAITQVLAADRATRHLVPSWQDIEVLDSVSKALGPLHEFTDALSAENYVTVSCLKPVLELFKSDLLQPKDSDTDLTRNIKSSVAEYLGKKYEEDPDLMEMVNMATMLDPRFHAKYLRPEDTQAVKDRAVGEMILLLPGQSTSATEPSEMPPESGPGEAKRHKKTLGSFFKRASSSEKTKMSNKEIIEAELNAYLLSPPADEESDPLAWWRLYEVKFPHVSQLAKKYLCIQATSAASERQFSTGGNIITCHRSALKPATVNRLVFLTKNLKLNCECTKMYNCS